jgi:NAD(P)H-hydrate epimerase
MDILTRKQARLVDQLAAEKHGMSSLSLMEEAGRKSALLLDQLHHNPDPRSAVIVCGKGNNGGDGLVMARHLQQLQYRVTVVLGDLDEVLSADNATNLQRLQENPRPGITLHREETTEKNLDSLEDACWFVDALLGTGSRGNPRPPSDVAIRWFNNRPARRVALDIPSGLDCDSGEIGTPCVQAAQTFTFVAPKPGLLLPASRPQVGSIHVIDIGIPRELLNKVLGPASSQDSRPEILEP